jgi:putative transcriptional regulator
MSKIIISARTRPDGALVEVLPDGKERPFAKTGLRAMSEAEVSAAAAADPDARPMTAGELRSARRVARVKTLRRVLGLTQEEFAVRYHIPVGTLRDWEQGRSEPDQPARAYLRAIAGDPAAISRALERGPR